MSIRSMKRMNSDSSKLLRFHSDRCAACVEGSRRDKDKVFESDHNSLKATTILWRANPSKLEVNRFMSLIGHKVDYSEEFIWFYNLTQLTHVQKTL